ncbi:hypothetical protein GCM10028815_01340 [Mariniluteicoccus flavus]
MLDHNVNRWLTRVNEILTKEVTTMAKKKDKKKDKSKKKSKKK